MDISDRNNISVEGKKIVVIGLGISGLAAIQLATFLKANVMAYDENKNETTEKHKAALDRQGIRVLLGGNPAEIFEADLWIVSPGIPHDSPLLKKTRKTGIPIVGEIEFASWFTSSPIIAITGSNGKTTTAHITAQMCQSKFRQGVLAGNVGHAFSLAVMDELQESSGSRIYVLEISSFQMEYILHFKPYIAVFLNISPDHLDRYPDMDSYVNAKINMCQNLKEDDIIIFNAGDPVLREKLSGKAGQKYTFIPHEDFPCFLTYDDKNIYYANGELFLSRADVALPGLHNLQNIMASASACVALGFESKHIKSVIQTFQGVVHRLERVIEIRDVVYYNDSKATNVDAVIVALQSFNQPIILILGGKDKGGDFKQLLPYTHNTKAVLAYGQARDKIATALADAVRLESMEGLRDAVHMSQQLASPGDIVLLSPGCASFDQFQNFEDRGNQFKNWVYELKAAG
ncbi:MAG: UDP-N-acetylmuramoyl-L-alanine--D-glutamate ligase [Fidelibacterota bacterium]